MHSDPGQAGWEQWPLGIVTPAQECRLGGETHRETEEEVAGEVQGLPLPCPSASRGKNADGSWSLGCLSQTPGFLKNTEQRHSKLRSQCERNRTEERNKWKNTLMCREQHTRMSLKLLLNVRYNAFQHKKQMCTFYEPTQYSHR